MLRETMACQPKSEQLLLNKKRSGCPHCHRSRYMRSSMSPRAKSAHFSCSPSRCPCAVVCGVEAWFALSPHIQTEIVNHTHSQCHTLPSLELKVYLQGRDSIKAADAFAKQTAVTVDPSTELDVVPIVPSDMDPNHAGVSHFEPLFKSQLVQPWTPSAFMESMVPMDSTR